MKKILVILMIFAMLCGCGQSEPIENAKSEPNEWGVTLNVKDVSAVGATVVFEQLGGENFAELSTGSYFRVEKDGKEVLQIIENVGWTAEAIIIPVGGELEMEANWEWIYGELEPGEYVIYKEVLDFRGTGDYDRKEYSAKFKVE